MKRLHDLYSHASEIPRSTRALANDICAGCVHYDTFLERHLEGKVVLRTDMQAALAQTVVHQMQVLRCQRPHSPFVAKDNESEKGRYEQKDEQLKEKTSVRQKKTRKANQKHKKHKINEAR